MKEWCDAAFEKGYVAFDTETTSLDAMQAELVGVSLSTEPGKACYVPLGHVDGEVIFLAVAVLSKARSR